MIDLIPEREFLFSHNKEEFKIIRSRHLYENRGKAKFSRDFILDKTRYIEIFKSAIRNGLRSFRGSTVVTLPTEENSYVSVLCEMKNNEIFVISVYIERTNFWKPFIKCRNRINILRDYKIPKMSNAEIRRKKMDCFIHNVDLEIQRENYGKK